jgi:hypothetical protein
LAFVFEGVVEEMLACAIKTADGVALARWRV